MNGSSITAKVESQEVLKIIRILNQIEKTGRKSFGIAHQAMIFAIKSAAKETKPGRGTNIARLPKKFRFRPAEKMPETGYFWYQWMPKGGGNPRFFKSDRKMRNRKGNLKRITRGIKYWNKKRNGWDYLPYVGTGKYNTSDKRFRIPYAGLAKLGWLAALRRLGQNFHAFAMGRANKVDEKYISTVVERKTAAGIYFEASNKVSYVAKTSPQSAAIGLRKARKRVEHIYLKKLKREMEREARK